MNKFITFKDNVLTAKIQDGPIKEVGVNGCQLDDVVSWVRQLLKQFDEKFPCKENINAITHLEHSIRWLEQRRIDREKRGVEGTSVK